MLDLIRRGSVAGLTAGIAVAAGVLVYDLLHLEPLATPGALSRNLMGGPATVTPGVSGLEWLPEVVRMAYGLFAYTVAHLSIFAAVGVFAAWVFRPGGAPMNVVTGAFFGMGIGTAVFYAGFGLLAPAFVDAPTWQLIVAMNAVAGVVLVAQLTDETQLTHESAPPHASRPV